MRDNKILSKIDSRILFLEITIECRKRDIDFLKSKSSDDDMGFSREIWAYEKEIEFLKEIKGSV